MKGVLTVCFALSLLLCAPPALTQTRPSTRTDGAPVPPRPTPDDPRGGAGMFPARGGDVDWGLALSGGGIRSAAFSVGVMKALYDADVLEDIDVISSVSGGGYASYWMFTRHKPSDAKFGESAFRDDLFVVNVCKLQETGKSEFFPLGKAWRVIYKGTFKTYREAIVSSFGGLDDDTRLDFLDGEMRRGKLPYFIINTTVGLSRRDKKVAGLNKEASPVFEITSHFRGNPALGFRDWKPTAADAPPSPGRRAYGDAPLTFGEAVAASGVPWWATRFWINNHEGSRAKSKRLYLSDGGHTENLGALALIRRRVKNIIIVDSEQDAGYRFSAYLDLKKMLAEEKIELCVPDIEQFLKRPNPCTVPGIKPGVNKSEDKKVFAYSPVSEGESRHAAGVGGAAPARSRIYYVKMTKPEPLFAERFADGTIVEKGYKIAEKRKADYERDGCDAIKLDFSAGEDVYANLYTPLLMNYSSSINTPVFRNNRVLWGKLMLINSTFGRLHPFFRYKFPHTTTLDQSYFSDQLEAFVGLGYLQTLELAGRIGKPDAAKF